MISGNSLTPETSEYIACFKTFIEKNRTLFDLEKIDQTRSVPLDVLNLQSDEEFKSKWPTFEMELFENPDKTLRLLEYCLHEVYVKIK